MTITLNDLRAEVTHALDGGEPSAQFTINGLINAAGIAFFDWHSWKFKSRQKTTLSTVSGSNRVELPPDFSEHVSIRRNTAGIQMVSMGEIALQDAGNVSRAASTGYYLGTIVYPTPEPSNPAVLPLPFLYIVPQPSGNTDTAFDLWYKSKWATLVEQVDISVTPNVTTYNAIAHVPTYCEAALREFCALYARGKEHDRMLEHMEVFSRSKLFEHAKRADGRQQSEYGPVTGGAVQVLTGRTQNFLATEQASAPS